MVKDDNDASSINVPHTDSSSAREQLLIISPVLDEATTIDSFIGALHEATSQLQDRYSIAVLLVVDPSSDGTEGVIENLVENQPHIEALFMARRAGHQASLAAGLDACTADVCVMMDADLQHPPVLLPALIDAYESGFDIVQAVRLDTEDERWVNAFLSRSFYRILNRFSDANLLVSASDFRLLSREAVEILQTNFPEKNKFLRGLIPLTGLPATSVTYNAPARSSGKTKYSLRRKLSLATTAFVSFSTIPLRLGLLASGLVAVGALVFGGAAAITYFGPEPLPAGWTTLVVLISLLSAIQLSIMGLIGIYLSHVLSEVRGRPPYIIRSSLNIDHKGNPRGSS